MLKKILGKFYKPFLIALIAALTACKTRQDTVNALEDINSPVEELVDGKHTSRNSIDWSGKYNGILNTANNKHKEFSLELSLNDSFILSSYYPTDSAIKSIKGNFNWDETGNYINIESLGWKVRVMEETIQIEKLNSNAELNFNEQTYLYKNKESMLLNRYWILSSISDSLSNLDTISNPAYLILNFTERANYYGGCNKCQTSFKSAIIDEIAFLKTGMCTKMYCPDGTHFDFEIESILSNTFYYEIKENTLYLKDKNKILGTFVSPF